jgi:Carboxymuconolactone decarboxylase family
VPIVTLKTIARNSACVLRGASNNGVTHEEIKEVVLQSAMYCGVPTTQDSDLWFPILRTEHHRAKNGAPRDRLTVKTQAYSRIAPDHETDGR